MSTTITTGDTTITPTIITGWEASQDSRNVIHTIIGRPSPDVTLKPAALRSGTLEMVFETAADAEEARQLHTDAVVFTLTSTDQTTINMTYVVSGNIGSVLEDVTRNLWIITVDFQEIDG